MPFRISYKSILLIALLSLIGAFIQAMQPFQSIHKEEVQPAIGSFAKPEAPIITSCNMKDTWHQKYFSNQTVEKIVSSLAKSQTQHERLENLRKFKKPCRECFYWLDLLDFFENLDMELQLSNHNNFSEISNSVKEMLYYVYLHVEPLDRFGILQCTETREEKFLYILSDALNYIEKFQLYMPKIRIQIVDFIKYIARLTHQVKTLQSKVNFDILWQLANAEEHLKKNN